MQEVSFHVRSFLGYAEIAKNLQPELNCMYTKVFDSYVQQSLEKLESLWQRSNDIPNPESRSSQQQQQLLQESLTELSTSIEELQLACETLRQQNEELLTNRQQIASETLYYQQLFDSAPDCYGITNSEGTIKEVNQKTTELLGISPQYLIRKSLAVFIALDRRQEYYSKLNQLKRGKISQATWQSEIVNRQKKAIAVEFQVNLLRDSSGKGTNLYWRISPVKLSREEENRVNLTPILINSLRLPLNNLAVQIEENQAEDKLDRQVIKRRWQSIRNRVYELQNTVNNGYIFNHFDGATDLHLSLIDYAIFIPNIVRHLNFQHNGLQQQIVIAPVNSYLSGINDVFILKHIIVNLLKKNTFYIPINNLVEINLSKNSVEQLIIKIKYETELQNVKQLQKTFSSLVDSNKYEFISQEELEIAVVKKCISLLRGQIDLDLQNSTNVTVTLKLPLILNLDR